MPNSKITNKTQINFPSSESVNLMIAKGRKDRSQYVARIFLSGLCAITKPFKNNFKTPFYTKQRFNTHNIAATLR